MGKYGQKVEGGGKIAEEETDASHSVQTVHPALRVQLRVQLRLQIGLALRVQL